jgi:hypothetical protein
MGECRVKTFIVVIVAVDVAEMSECTTSPFSSKIGKNKKILTEQILILKAV